MNLQPLQDFIQQYLGLSFTIPTGYPWRERLLKRLQQTGVSNAQEYLALLQQDEAELAIFISSLTINETYFYREAEHLRLLTTYLIPRWQARQFSAQAKQPLRILSLGCSSGEEPYSILISLREQYGNYVTQPLVLTACDVDQAVLDRARAGCYGAASFRALPQELRTRYFTPIAGNQEKINENLSHQVVWRQLNLLALCYPDDLRGQDIVFFRNVLLYFDLPTRKRVLAQIKELLNPEGVLIVGITETLANHCGIFTLIEHQGVFFFTCSEASLSTELETKTNLFKQSFGLQKSTEQQTPIKICTTAQSTTESIYSIDKEVVYKEALALAYAERYTEALARIEPLCTEITSYPPALALKAYLLLEQGSKNDAVSAAQQALTNDPWCLEALLFLARIEYNQGNQVAAIGLLRRAIYHRPDFWRAHFQLAEIYRLSGQKELAQREYRIVLYQLAQNNSAENAGKELGLLPLPISRRDLALLCEQRLNQLNLLIPSSAQNSDLTKPNRTMIVR